jgi:hypothetical protein
MGERGVVVAVVDINALVEKLARWRGSPLGPPSSLGEQEGQGKEEAHPRRRLRAVVQLLEPFLDALPREAMELRDHDLALSAAAAAAAAAAGGDGPAPVVVPHQVVEAVCLNDWVFGSSGPHACLSFLDRRDHDHDPALCTTLHHDDDDDDDADKQALFNRLGPALIQCWMDVWRDHHHHRCYTAGKGLSAVQLFRRLWQALSMLAAARRRDGPDGGGGGGGSGDMERTALVLIDYLRLVCASSRPRTPVWQAEEAAAGLLEEVVQASANVAVGALHHNHRDQALLMIVLSLMVT